MANVGNPRDTDSPPPLPIRNPAHVTVPTTGKSFVRSRYLVRLDLLQGMNNTPKKNVYPRHQQRKL